MKLLISAKNNYNLIMFYIFILKTDKMGINAQIILRWGNIAMVIL